VNHIVRVFLPSEAAKVWYVNSPDRLQGLSLPHDFDSESLSLGKPFSDNSKSRSVTSATPGTSRVVSVESSNQKPNRHSTISSNPSHMARQLAQSHL
jgi:hypothetical protein